VSYLAYGRVKRRPRRRRSGPKVDVVREALIDEAVSEDSTLDQEVRHGYTEEERRTAASCITSGG